MKLKSINEYLCLNNYYNIHDFMINAAIDNIHSLIIHTIGNKYENEQIRLSDSETNIEDPNIRSLLTKYFTGSFKWDEFYNFYHTSNIDLNDLYSFVTGIFEHPDEFYQQSVKIAKYLYEQSTHPKIKAGELYVVYFTGCKVEGKTVDAIGLFKSETKDTFLKVYPSGSAFKIESERGININKLDKGCLVFNTSKENGYLVAVVDNTNKGVEAKYWTEDFLHIRPRKDSYSQTQNMLFLCQEFVSQISDEDGKVQKAILMNKSINALKKESVNTDEFAKKVFEQPELVERFTQYKQSYEKNNDVTFDDQFEPNTQAFKRKGMGTMTTIKLDKNFDIRVHGGEQLIERGYDEEREMYFYRLFFKEEK